MFEFSLKKLRIVNYCLTLLILVALLMLIRGLINVSLARKNIGPIVTRDKIALNITPARKDIMSYSTILVKNPFGSPMEFYPIATPQKADRRQGSLSELMLVGTVVGPESLSYAIFEIKSQTGARKQEVIAYRENVYNYGILTKIEATSVELKQGADIIKIPLIDIENSIKKTRTNNIVSSRSKTRLAKKISERQYLLNRRKVQQALENPEQILTDARLLPNIQNGRQEGFKIYEVRPGGLYENLGLRNGDIILKINDLEISNPEIAIQAMSALRGMNKINLDIIRNGEKLSMNYQIK